MNSRRVKLKLRQWITERYQRQVSPVRSGTHAGRIQFAVELGLSAVGWVRRAWRSSWRLIAGRLPSRHPPATGVLSADPQRVDHHPACAAWAASQLPRRQNIHRAKEADVGSPGRLLRDMLRHVCQPRRP